MADAVLRFPNSGSALVLAALYHGRDTMCCKCKNLKAHTADNYRSCDEIRAGKPYRYVKRICRKCEHIARVKMRRITPPKPQGPERFARQRRQNLKKNFGITPEQYDVMLQLQHGRCAICRAENNHRAGSGRVQNFAVDHCHDTGRIRGLLCGSCNIGLGRFKDNPNFLMEAAAYLERYK